MIGSLVAVVDRLQFFKSGREKITRNLIENRDGDIGRVGLFVGTTAAHFNVECSYRRFSYIN